MRNKILNKVNEGQEADVIPYTWKTIPETLKQFWHNYYESNTKI